jgi:phosphoribosyl 1,2-cyclic phosphate phosphodiesterase
MMMGRLTVTILGCGSSGGVPRVGNDWGICDPAEPKNRRRRCSIWVLYQEEGTPAPTSILIDTSPDLREQFLDAGIDRLDAVLMTHDHADQTHGIDDLRAIVYRQRARIPVFMDAVTGKTLTERFGYIFETPPGSGYPPLLDRQPDLVPLQPVSIHGPGGALTVLPLEQDHGGSVSLGFRFGDVAYCNDVVDLPEASLAALNGVSLFIVDALQHKPHPTHAHLARSLAWAERIGADRTVLTNLHINMDYNALKAEVPSNVEPAYDGLMLTL